MANKHMEVFDTIYRENLDRLKEINLLNRSKALDLQIVSGKITISFFGRTYAISEQGVTDMEFPALPHIPVYISFNDRDEDLPAQSNLLFDKSVEHYLDLKSIFVIGTFLADSLINQDL